MVFTKGGVRVSGLHIDPFWNLTKKSENPFEIFMPNAGLQNMILRAVFEKSDFHFLKIFRNNLDF